jgi:hypothetical protein
MTTNTAPADPGKAAGKVLEHRTRLTTKYLLRSHTMAKPNSTSVTTGAQGATTVPSIDPTSDAVTLHDTLSYAMQPDADPQQVLQEVVQLLTPYCQSRSTLGHLRSLLHGTSARLGGDQTATPRHPSALGALPAEERITLLQEENAVLAEAVERLEQRQDSPVATDSRAELVKMGERLNHYGALLAGIEEICDRDEVAADALGVVADTCRKINRKICRIGDRLRAIAEEGGAA